MIVEPAVVVAAVAMVENFVVVVVGAAVVVVAVAIVVDSVVVVVAVAIVVDSVVVVVAVAMVVDSAAVVVAMAVNSAALNVNSALVRAAVAEIAFVFGGLFCVESTLLLPYVRLEFANFLFVFWLAFVAV